jgi:hypothetical protein
MPSGRDNGLGGTTAGTRFIVSDALRNVLEVFAAAGLRGTTPSLFSRDLAPEIFDHFQVLFIG